MAKFTEATGGKKWEGSEGRRDYDMSCACSMLSVGGGASTRLGRAFRE